MGCGVRTLQQAAQEFFDECVRNGVAPEVVAFKLTHVEDFTGSHYLFQSASIEGRIITSDDYVHD